MAKLKRRRRRLGEIVTRKEAIRNQCFECMGYSHAEIGRCCAPECWLYPFRQGAVDDEEMESEKQKAKAETAEQKAVREKEEQENETIGHDEADEAEESEEEQED